MWIECTGQYVALNLEIGLNVNGLRSLKYKILFEDFKDSTVIYIEDGQCAHEVMFFIKRKDSDVRCEVQP